MSASDSDLPADHSLNFHRLSNCTRQIISHDSLTFHRFGQPESFSNAAMLLVSIPDHKKDDQLIFERQASQESSKIPLHFSTLSQEVSSYRICGKNRDTSV